MGASVERCVHNRRDGAVHGGDTHLGSASGHKRMAMCELATRGRGARDMAWGVGGDGRVLGGGWMEPRGAERGRCRWVRGCGPRGCGAERCGARAVRVA